MGWEVGLVPPAKAEAVRDFNGSSVSAQYLVCSLGSALMAFCHFLGDFAGHTFKR